MASGLSGLHEIGLAANPSRPFPRPFARIGTLKPGGIAAGLFYPRLVSSENPPSL